MQRIETRGRATLLAPVNSRLHLSGGKHNIHLLWVVVEESNIPLKATYTLAEISISFTTSDGLNPNDILLRVRRAQARVYS